MGTSLAAEALLSLAVSVTSEQRVESVLQSIVQGLASQPGVALARIWLLPSVHHPSFYHVVSDAPDCLCLVASAGTPINSPGEDWCFLQGHFSRVGFNVGKVGQVAASRHPILVEDVSAQNDWVVRPEWAKREEIHSLAGHPLIFRDKLLGVIAVFSRQPLGQPEFTWLGLFANQAAVAIANACAEEALKSSEGNLAAMINTIPTAAWTTRPDGHCDFLNRVWLDYTGMTAEQAQGWGWAEAIHSDDRKKLVEEWQSCLGSGTPVDTEARIRRSDSSYRWFLIRANPLRDESGNILKWYGTNIDIEDRKRGEEALRASERNARLIVDTIPGLVGVTSPSGELEILSQGMLEYFGKPLEEMRHWEGNDVIHPEDLPRAIRVLAQALASEQPLENEARLRRFDGVYRWFQLRGSAARDKTGRVARWCFLMTDVDDLKRAEDALRASERSLKLIVDTIPTLAWSARPDGSADFFNQHYLDFAGLSAEQASGWGWTEAIHPEDRKRLVEDWQSCLVSGAPVDRETRIRRFDSSYRWFLIRANPLRDESGNILRWYGTNIDIEDRKRGEEALRAREVSWRQIVDNIPGLVATTGAMGEVEFLNRQTLKYFGNTSEELKNWALTDAVHPDDLPRVIEARKKSIETGQIYEIEHRCRRGDGVYRWFQVRGIPVRDTENKITAWYLLLTDIDDRKKAEEALQSSERNLSLMISVIPTYIHVLRADGSVLYANQAVLEYMGITLEDVQREDYRTRFFHAEDVERLREERREALTRAVPFENEQRVLGKDGRYRWFLVRYNPLLDEQGRVERWYVAALDIEDRKRFDEARRQAEQALRQSEERARLIVDSIDALVMTATPKGEVEFVNEQVLDYFGKSIEELKGWGTSDAIHRDDLSHAQSLWTHSVETGDPYKFEQRLRRADGTYRWFQVHGRCLRDAQGHVMRWYVLLTDIDNRKQAEAQVEQAYLRLAEAQRLSKTGSFITDLVADDHNWSEETFRIFEFDPATKVTVQRIRDIILAEDLPSFDIMIARAMEGKDVDFVFRVVTSGGAVKHVRGMARVIEQIAGRPLFIGALQDVTESKLAEEALNRARSELAHVTRVTTLNALTASIAHEVNQPLSGVVSNASASLRFLAGNPPNLEEAREAVRDIIRDGKRAGEIITRIRALTKRTVAPREKLDLNETISEVLALIGDEAKRNSVIVRTQFADTLSPVLGDRVQLQQVVLNLVMNAIEAMSSVSEWPRELVITTCDIDADWVQATVEDSGIGIAADTVDKIFDSFYTTKSGGMGMGLSISRSILQSHGGRLWAVGKDGPGTMFQFTVPKYREEGAHGRVTGT